MAEAGGVFTDGVMRVWRPGGERGCEPRKTERRLSSFVTRVERRESEAGPGGVVSL